MKLKEFISYLTEFDGEMEFRIIDADTDWLLNVEDIVEIKTDKNKILCVGGYYDEHTKTISWDLRRKIN